MRSQSIELTNEELKWRYAKALSDLILTNYAKSFNVVKETGLIRVRFIDVVELGKKLGLKPGQVRILMAKYIPMIMVQRGYRVIHYRTNKRRSYYIFQNVKWGENFLNPPGESPGR